MAATDTVLLTGTDHPSCILRHVIHLLAESGVVKVDLADRALKKNKRLLGRRLDADLTWCALELVFDLLVGVVENLLLGSTDRPLEALDAGEHVKQLKRTRVVWKGNYALHRLEFYHVPAHDVASV